jgi:hypothetical protein
MSRFVSTAGDAAQVLVGVAAALEAAERRGMAARAEVAVRVLEAREDHGATEVADAGVGPPHAVDLGRAPDGGDPAVGHGERLGRRAGRVNSLDDRVAKDQIGGHGG